MNDLNRRYADQFKAENDAFNRLTRRVGGFILVVWVVAAALSLTLTGVVIWGIIKLVQHFTA